MQPAIVHLIVGALAGVGALLVLIHFATGGRRAYLLYFGLAAICLGISVYVSGVGRLVVAALALGLFIWGIMESVQESRHRWLEQQLHQREREVAFAEVETARARKDAAEEDAARQDEDEATE
jgi:membrane protein implicated in regulation of membrane protease activity